MREDRLKHLFDPLGAEAVEGLEVRALSARTHINMTFSRTTLAI